MVEQPFQGFRLVISRDARELAAGLRSGRIPAASQIIEAEDPVTARVQRPSGTDPRGTGPATAYVGGLYIADALGGGQGVAIGATAGLLAAAFTTNAVGLEG